MQGALDVLLAPESRQKAAEEQEQLRKVYGDRIVTDPALVTFYWGKQLENSVLQQLQPDDFSENGQHLLQRLSDAYAAQARFTEAAEFAASDEQKETYSKYAAAIAHAGERQCSCPSLIKYPLKDNAKGVQLESLGDVLRVSDGARVFTLRACRHCGAISAFVNA